MSATTRYCARCLTTFQSSPEACTNLSCGAPVPEGGWGVLLGPGDTLDRHYRIIKALAVGGAGLTYLARELDDNDEPQEPDLAIKVLYSARAAGPFLRRLSTEAQILQDLNHENIVRCRGFVHREGHDPYLVTLFERGGSLDDFVSRHGPLSPLVAADITRQILLALDVAHQRGVVHRDLKPDNVLLSHDQGPDKPPLVRVADFGIAKVSGGVGQGLTRSGAFIGTPEYASPEQFEGAQPTWATDVFSAGGVLYYMLTARAPVSFTHRLDLETSYDELLDQIPPRLPDQGRSDETDVQILQQILDHTMVADPGRRWTVRQVIGRLDLVLGRLPTFAAPTLDVSRPEVSGPKTLNFTHESAPPRDAEPSRPTAPPKHISGPPTGQRPVVPPRSKPRPAPKSHAPVRNEPSNTSGNVVAGAVAGLGLGVIVLGAILVVGLGLGAAWAMGAFSGLGEPSTGSTATEQRAQDPLDLSTSTAPEHRALLTQIEQSLLHTSRDIAKVCGTRTIPRAELHISAAGALTEVLIDPAGLSLDQQSCVLPKLKTMPLPNTTGQALTLKVSLMLKP